MLQRSMATAAAAERFKGVRKELEHARKTYVEGKAQGSPHRKGYEKKGVSHREAEHRAWATVNKQD
jgi:hypothetical protein